MACYTKEKVSAGSFWVRACTLQPSAGPKPACVRAGCKSAYFKDANHWLYLEQPEAFNTLVSDFLSAAELTQLPNGVSSKRPEEQ